MNMTYLDIINYIADSLKLKDVHQFKLINKVLSKNSKSVSHFNNLSNSFYQFVLLNKYCV